MFTDSPPRGFLPAAPSLRKVTAVTQTESSSAFSFLPTSIDDVEEGLVLEGNPRARSSHIDYSGVAWHMLGSRPPLQEGSVGTLMLRKKGTWEAKSVSWIQIHAMSLQKFTLGGEGLGGQTSGRMFAWHQTHQKL